MLFLVRDFLDFSQLEAKSLILDLQPCNIIQLIRECLDILRFKADQKGIGLNLNIHGGDGNIIIVTDENRLR
jgi:signal transduction histidine kinase